MDRRACAAPCAASELVPQKKVTECDQREEHPEDRPEERPGEQPEERTEERPEEQRGYCGLCRVLYGDLNQHLSSHSHLEAVSCRGAESSSAQCLLERFLQDVLKHHPHRYGNSQPDPAQPPGQSSERPLLDTPASPQLPQVTWSMWQRTRRHHQREDFSSEHCSSTIEEVIRRYCYNDGDDGSGSIHFSLNLSAETQTEWELDFQDVPGRAVPLLEVEALLRTNAEVEQDYSEQLQWALEPSTRRAGGGFLERPIEQVLPLPQLIPASFRGKSWAQIEREDEARVMKLVQQFQRGVRTCYFDSESLARFGQSGYSMKKMSDLLSLLECEEEEEVEAAARRKRERKRPCLRLAARCQVVKLSKATQTQCVSPLTVTAAPEAPSHLGLTPVGPVCPVEVTPVAPPPDPPWSSGPLSERYGSVLTPLQGQTSMLFLLIPPPGHAPQGSHQSSSLRRRPRLARPLRSKVTYKRLPLTRITVKPSLIKPRSMKLRCVRQLFRNLSPEVNRAAPSTPPRREGLRCRPPRT